MGLLVSRREPLGAERRRSWSSPRRAARLPEWRRSWAVLYVCTNVSDELGPFRSGAVRLAVLLRERLANTRPGARLQPAVVRPALVAMSAVVVSVAGGHSRPSGATTATSPPARLRQERRKARGGPDRPARAAPSPARRVRAHHRRLPGAGAAAGRRSRCAPSASATSLPATSPAAGGADVVPASTVGRPTSAQRAMLRTHRSAGLLPGGRIGRLTLRRDGAKGSTLQDPVIGDDRRRRTARRRPR